MRFPAQSMHNLMPERFELVILLQQGRSAQVLCVLAVTNKSVVNDKPGESTGGWGWVRRFCAFVRYEQGTAATMTACKLDSRAQVVVHDGSVCAGEAWGSGDLHFSWDRVRSDLLFAIVVQTKIPVLCVDTVSYTHLTLPTKRIV
eukprot:TRINITY_DN4631_c0_g1_i8.p3 TRINITY_DN4631_c0_g1~~TRINITY_DN4631_c0_g1_i8.p3  ORF type:complete len:145 (+),score=15.69 TRINITY_DN4631_c0_g1_i8:897-1331(+)